MEGAGGKQHLRDCSCGSPPLVQSCWLSGACEGVNVASVFFLGGARGVGDAGACWASIYQRFVQLWGTRETRMWRNRSPNPHRMLVCSCHNCVGVKTVIS